MNRRPRVVIVGAGISGLTAAYRMPRSWDVTILESGDRELIRTEVGGYIDGMKERGARLVFGSDHSLSTNVDYDDFRFALDVYREHQAY